MLLAAQEKISDRRPASPDVALRIYWPAGTLRVTAWTKDTVAVSGYVDPALGRFFFGGVLAGMKLGVEAPETAATQGSAVLDVSVPSGARIWIKSVNGDIEVNDVTGTVEVFTVGGQLRVSGSPSVVTAESMDGNIELVVQSPDATARTASGTVVLRGVIRNATASSISGPLFIGMEGKIARARFETVSGEIAFKGDLDPDGSLEAESHSGDIELRLPERLGATYDLAAYSGPVSSEFQNLGAPVRKGEWRLVVGDGRAHVAVRTFKGKVEVKKR
jgi:DUF4097 and DUF4098 domain-containing protein YvlB